MAKLGCCATSFRMILIIMNTLFFIFGLLLLILGLVLKYTTVLNKFMNIDGISTLITSTTISGFLIFVIVIAVFCMVVSLFGLIGSCCTNRFFLICYEVVIVLLFLAQAIALMVLLFSSSKVEKEFKNGLNKTVEDINNKTSSYQSNCALMESLSSLFECCGANGPNDFKNVEDRYKCCDVRKNSTLGCGDKIVKSIKGNYVGFIVVPNSLILGIELFAIVTVPFLIGRIGRG
jgi:hypothetical protein